MKSIFIVYCIFLVLEKVKMHQSIDISKIELFKENLWNKKEGHYNTFFYKRKRNAEEQDSPLKFSPTPTSKNFEIGQSGKIHCKVNGSATVYWKKDLNEDLPADAQDVNGTLHFKNIDLPHRGKYTCHATDSKHQISASIEVNLLPDFKVSPIESLEIVEMESFLLDCSAKGYPMPTVKWNYDGKILDRNQIHDDRFTIFENFSLLLHEARQEDSGTYACIIGNSAGIKRKESQIVIKPMDSFSSFENSENGDGIFYSKAILMTCILSIIYIFLVIVLMLWCRKRRSASQNVNEMKNDDTASDGDGEEKPLESSSLRTKIHHKSEKSNRIKSNSSSPLVVVDENLNIKYDRLIELCTLGNGQYGEVLKGYLMNTDIPTSSVKWNKENSELDAILTQKKCKVLIKSIFLNSDARSKDEFRNQIDLFRTINSIHVAKLLALSIENDHQYMILEHGVDLKTFLKEEFDKKGHEENLLTKMCSNVIKGLKHIHKLNFIHRDLALRNCVFVNNLVKITASTLCKDTHSKEFYIVENCALPIRHIAPEVVSNTIFTSSSDVFSLGVLLWEILTYGHRLPHQSLTLDELYGHIKGKSLDFEKSLLEDGKFDDKMRSLLMKCFSYDPKERPSASELDDLYIKLFLQNNA